MNSYDFFIYKFICFMNSYMNSGVLRFQMDVRLVLQSEVGGPTSEASTPPLASTYLEGRRPDSEALVS